MGLKLHPNQEVASRRVLTSLLERPDLTRFVADLPPPTFAALVREVGVEDAGELVAFATTEQLVQAFDESLFRSERAGEREDFDAAAFATWLDVLLEAGEQRAAQRLSELDEDFVVHALSSLVLVLEVDGLRERMLEGDSDDVWQLEKAMESALMEELDGYLLVARRPEGWDAVLTLILALDRDQRRWVERILDRLALLASSYLDDLEELSSVLSDSESLAEDVEAAREQRRSEQGYVEPRAARAFLELAFAPLKRATGAAVLDARDPLTSAYFRELRPAPALRGPRAGHTAPTTMAHTTMSDTPKAQIVHLLESRVRPPLAALAHDDTTFPLMGVLRELRESEPAVFDIRQEELAYLVNILLAAVDVGDRRMRPAEAAEAALVTVYFGAVLEWRSGQGRNVDEREVPDQRSLLALLSEWPLDVLFRRASAALAESAASSASAAAELALARERGFLSSNAELPWALRFR